MGHRLFREAEEEVWRTTPPDWERIRQWFEVRFALACEHSDLYHLIWEHSVPAFTPSQGSQQELRMMLDEARGMIGEAIEAEGLDAGRPPGRGVAIPLAAPPCILPSHS